MKKQLIECVPNFSEGCDLGIIKQITNEIEGVEGVKLIDVDPGATTNRTVVTFVGEPEAVCEAAYWAIKKAAELIDMSKHKGAHPRFGACDVCPLVPVANISMEEVVLYAHKLAKRVGEDLGVPVYCYEFAAQEEKRRNLANCRSGEYEGVKDKIVKAEWKPDFGPAEFTPSVARSGVTAIGARNFLVAINYNLNTTSTRRANSVAFDVREKGRVKRIGDPITGDLVLDANGEKLWEPGILKGTKAIGWFIDEFGIAQVSMNITDITVTPVHEAFDAVSQAAQARGIRVTGSEIVGVIPKSVLVEAGKHYLKKQQRSAGVSEKELVKIAVKSMGLDDLAEFDPQKKVIEYLLHDESASKLVKMNLVDFADETASESPAPGGGSISAYMGALGVSLGTMVANLSSHKRGWDDRWEDFSMFAEKGMDYQQKLLSLVDEDTNAFNKIMEAFSLAKKTAEEKAARNAAIQEATRYAIDIPFATMKLCYESMEIMKAMVEKGNPNSVTDAGVGALAARSAVIGAYFNVKINVQDLEDKAYVEKVLKEGAEIEKKAMALEAEIIKLVNEKIS